MLTRRSAILAPLALAGTQLTPARAQEGPAEAVVVNTDVLRLRASASRKSAVRRRVPLGERVVVTGEGKDGFLPVEYEGERGFAEALYLATDPLHVPFLERGERGCSRVAFLFNIGVGFDPDEGILDTLRREKVPATMFPMGWWVDEEPAILERMVEEGYPIGSHGYDALTLPDFDDETVLHDLRDSVTAIETAIGRPMDRIFTPFAAAIDERVRAIVANDGILPVSWTVSAMDYAEGVTPEAVWDSVVPYVEDGVLIEFHLDAPSSAKSTGVALPWIIESLRDRGYSFVTVPEMAAPCSIAKD